MSRDPHYVLGVSPEATLEQIHRAWCFWITFTCPDRFDREKNPERWEAENAKLQAVHQAYETLTKAKARTGEAHDLQRTQATDEPPPLN